MIYHRTRKCDKTDTGLVLLKYSDERDWFQPRIGYGHPLDIYTHSLILYLIMYMNFGSTKVISRDAWYRYQLPW
jgi:hypothetical protein